MGTESLKMSTLIQRIPQLKGNMTWKFCNKVTFSLSFSKFIRIPEKWSRTEEGVRGIWQLCVRPNRIALWPEMPPFHNLQVFRICSRESDLLLPSNILPVLYCPDFASRLVLESTQKSSDTFKWWWKPHMKLETREREHGMKQPLSHMHHYPEPEFYLWGNQGRVIYLSITLFASAFIRYRNVTKI